MKTIFQNAAHIAAIAQASQLQQAHAAAVLEEAGLLAHLTDQPDSKPSALDRAKAMLTGGTPAPRQDRDGLHTRLAACRETLALLGQAIGEQRDIMAALVSAQSAIVNSERKAEHIKAAERIKTALAGLKSAMDSEASLRAEFEAGGYACTLEPMARPELCFDDSQATIARFARDVDAFLMVTELAAVKSVNVRLLYGTGGDMPGDVLAMSGHEAAARVRVGHAEQTRDKPSRVTRAVITSYGMTMATALS